MTLIVGMANAEIGFMVGDTLLTPLLEVKGNPTGAVNGEFHGLKIQILNDKIAIGFSSSNSAETALSIVSNVWRALQTDPDVDVCAKLSDDYQQSLSSAADEKPDCEFLVLQLGVSSNGLAHITAEGIQRCERAYIGDQAQYKQMNALRKPYDPPKEQYVQQPDGTFQIEKTSDSKGQIEFMEVSSAMEELVQQRNTAVGAIGGNVIRVCDAWPSGKLEYMQAGIVSLSAEEGQSGFSLLSSCTGTRGVGIYYRSGKLGFLMIVGDAETCRKESSETIQSFIELASQQYGMNLVGPT
ncbi:hypothetical protein IVA79_24215 [Bradyrhizobium sp. 138]|uniref:hypothetical protein n=1 Tax=Bradyrhizobium sp. 138 TaxID=2782615 RepID=UPI001FFB0511|nr:hypothetical protein [Bradyrhizobium sp. 138]MCK1736989.1 hypothetical protein [Bradyrhizobium sp. 138]